MVVRYALYLMMVLSGGVICGMENSEFELPEMMQCARITKGHGMFEGAIAEIKVHAKDNPRFAKVFNNKKATEQLLDFVGGRCPGFWREGHGIGCCDRQGFYKERGAAVLGTPGAIEFGREYVKNNEKAKKELEIYLSNIVVFGRKDDGIKHNGFIFADEGVDIIKAGLDILIDFPIKSDLLVEAAYRKKMKTVELLISRNANVNAIDYLGRTPLMMAAMGGHGEIVKKLLEANAAVWLIDGYDKTALDHAMNGLWNCKEEKKETYNAIVKLLVDAGAQ